MPRIIPDHTQRELGVRVDALALYPWRDSSQVLPTCSLPRSSRPYPGPLHCDQSPARPQWHSSLPCFLLLLSHSRDDSQTDHLHPRLGSHSAFGEPKLKTFPGGSDGKESTCEAGDLGLVPGLGRSPGGGHGNPLQYPCLENPHGQRSLVGYSPQSRKESDMTEVTQHTHTWFSEPLMH